MASVGTLTVNGMVFPVVLLSSSAQAIDDAVSNMGAASTPQAALSALGAGVQPNGVLNPFALINQAGQSSYSNPTGSTVYAFDGRKGRHFDVSLSNGVETISIAGVSSGAARYGAVVPQGVQAGKTYTASVFIKATSVTGDPYFMCSNNLTNTGTAIFITQVSQDYVILSTTFTAASDGSSVLLELVCLNGRSLTADVYGWKIEEGEGQTLAYQDSTGAWHRLPQPEDVDYAGQLAKCEYYHKRFSGNLCIVGFGFAMSSNFIMCLVSLPHGLRISNPTATLSGTIYAVSSLGYGASSIAITSQPQGAVIAQSGNLLSFTLSTSGLEIATGTSVTLQIRDTTSYFDIAADL